MMEADFPYSLTICEDGEEKDETPAAAAQTGVYPSADRPNFSENF